MGLTMAPPCESVRKPSSSRIGESEEPQDGDKTEVFMGFEVHIPDADKAAEQISTYTGQKVDPETARKLWPKIMQHKWYMSEKLDRDVGFKIACLDFLENVEPDYRKLGAQIMDPSIWDSISETQPPKQIVNRRIILPLTQTDLALKHKVVQPRTIILFGPPGTGKTHFVRAIAGVLGWRYIEVSPAVLMAEGEQRLGANLKQVMERVRRLDEVVVFMDEFEEIAASRDQASRMEKSVTNEFLKQVPLLKTYQGRILLICATNYIRQLDPALLRPGRFDCIIPVGPLDEQSRRTIFQYYLSNTNRGEVDAEKIISMISLFTPADIEYLFQKVRQFAFEREYDKREGCRVTTETFLEIIPRLRPSLSEKMIGEFEQDCERYSRY